MDSIDLQLALGRSAALTAPLLHSLAARAALPLDLQALYRSSQRMRRLVRAVDPAQIAADRQFVDREAITLLDITSADYPPLLARIPEPPTLLYVKGEVATLKAAQLAMAGSRTPSDAGRRVARNFAQELSRLGLTITCGLAAGIDAAGHEGALAAGARTVAVLAAGLDQMDASAHAQLAMRIAMSGAVISEFPPGSPPLGHHFPRRNRIISGLCIAMLVVEADRQSGALITARLAAEQGREVFAVPGSIENPMSRGCHALIRDGARLVGEAADIVEELKFIAPKQVLMKLQDSRAAARARLAALDKNYKILLDALEFESANFNDLVIRTGFPSQSVASMLLILELEGAVGLQAGGRYVRL